MPSQNTHEIFRKELELFRNLPETSGREIFHCDLCKLEADRFLLASLRRASLAEVEGVIGGLEKKPTEDQEDGLEYDEGFDAALSSLKEALSTLK